MEQQIAAQVLIKPEEAVEPCQKTMLTQHQLATMPMKSAQQNRTHSYCNES
jgi:hypothetical protein